MKDIYYLIEPEDKVCYNCDNFVREHNNYVGKCILKEKHYDNDNSACDKFEWRDAND